jgi:hypothetical protein
VFTNTFRDSETKTRKDLASETVESAALAFEGIDDVHGSHSLAAGVLRVGHGVTDDILQESLQNTASLLVDGVRDTFIS